jgi:hypothetical protein
MEAAALPIDLRARLDAWLDDVDGDLAPLFEWAAERMGCDDGEHWIRVKLSNGHYREGGLDHTRIGRGELRSIVRLNRGAA